MTPEDAAWPGRDRWSAALRRAWARRLYGEGVPVPHIARRLGLTRSGVYKALARAPAPAVRDLWAEAEADVAGAAG